MINSAYLDCVVVNKMRNAFRRTEKDGYVLYIPKGKSYDDVRVINAQGEQIMEYAKKEPTVREIIEYLRDENPEISYAKIEEDVYRFLQSAVASNILRIKGIDDMYNGETVSKIGEYEIYRCKEGDTKRVIETVIKGGSFLEMTDPLLSGGMYNGVTIRARIFNFSEEFYLLLKNGETLALVSIVNGKLYVNGNSFVGKLILNAEVPSDIMESFIKAVTANYKANVNKAAQKIRLRAVMEDKKELVDMLEVYTEAGFKEVAFFEKDFNGKDVRMYDMSY